MANTSDCTSGDISVYYLNNKGEVQWSKHFGTADNNNIGQLVANVDGSLAVAMTGEVSPGNQGPVITKISSTGSVVWSKGYSFTDVQSAAPYLTGLPDGGFLLHGQQKNPGDTNPKAFIMKLDSDGNEIWGQRVTSPDRVVFSRRAYVTSSGDYLLCGDFWKAAVTNYDVFLIKMDSAGTFQFFKSYGRSASTINSYDVVEQNGNYVIGGDYTNGSGDYKSWIIKTDLSGNLLE